MKAPFYLASSEGDAFEGAPNVAAWSQGLDHITTRVTGGSAHAMAIYFDVRNELHGLARRALSR